MTASHPWRGVRLRTVETAADPDATLHRVSIPAEWGEAAARGFVGLACHGDRPGWEPVRLPDAAANWIGRLARAGRLSGLLADAAEFAETLHCMLLLRQGCPDRGVWLDLHDEDRGFVLNLAAFADPDTGFDDPCFLPAVRAAGLAASIAAAGRGLVRVADIDGMLARLGFDYDSQAGRTAARDLLRKLRRALDAGGKVNVALQAGPARSAEALLGVETAGFAPAFSPVGPDGSLTLAARARLASLGLSPERALALTLDGASPLRVSDHAAHLAMHDELAPLLDTRPARPSPLPPRLVTPVPAQAGTPVRRAMPARSKGFTQKVSIGGQRMFLRTGEYADGSLGEVALTLSGRDAMTARGLAEAFSTAMSLALQHGVPLDAFVEAFAHGRFGASGPVEGDPAILSASSPLDYALRALAGAYGGRHIEDPPADAAEPLLPLGLTAEDEGAGGAARPRQRALRLVSPA